MQDLSLDELASLTAGADFWRLPELPARDIRALMVSDGPIGARGDAEGGEPSLAFPCGAAVGATWDPDLAREMGAVLALETRDKGAQVLLAPTVNLQRHPLGGRNFECLSEDPELTAALAVGLVQGLQSAGVGACVKHFVANDQETDRLSISSEVEEAVLREVYLRPFEAVIAAADPWSIMAAYNQVNGVHATEHPGLLSDVLRTDWSWDGVVISDWYATHSTVAAAVAGLDLEMPGPASFLGPHLAEAVRSGTVDARVVEEKGRRLLRLLDRAGLIGPAAAHADAMVDRAAVARQVCRESIVLLRNTGALPIDRHAVRRVAVIGPAAHPGFDQGGGSAQVTSIERTSPLDGLRAALGEGVEVSYVRGCAASSDLPELAARLIAPDGWQVEVWSSSFDGEPLVRTRWQDIRFSYLGASLPGVQRSRPMRVRCTTTLTPDQTGEWKLACRTSGVATITVDGQTVVERTEHERPLTFFAHEVSLREGVATLEAGRPVEVVVEFAVTARDVLPHLYIGAVPPYPAAEIAAAVEIAREADAAVVVVGTGREAESEGFDRPTMSLPGSQDALVSAVAAVQPNTVVVVAAGSPVDMPWAGEVAAVVQAWFGGQEAGTGLADVLLGDCDASGRLPMTIPRTLSDMPAYSTFPGDGTVVRYDEGLLVGHRWLDAHGFDPAYAFGFGLSYTTFRYAEPKVLVGPEGEVELSVEVTNTGEREGIEVVQVYLGDSRPDRPPRRLVGFAKLRLAAGATQLARIRIPARAFADWDVAAHCWRVSPRTARLHIGRSSRDLQRETTVEIEGRDLRGAQR